MAEANSTQQRELFELVTDKRCSTCRTVKPIGSFCLSVRSKDGRHYSCRSCCRRRRQTAKTKSIRAEALIPKEKECRRCGITKPLEHFYKNPMCKDGHIHTCRGCTTARDQLKQAERMAKRGPLPSDDTEKQCRYCGEIKPLKKFREAFACIDGRRQTCKACYIKASREQRRDHRLKTNFGLTRDQYDAMHRAQSGLCGICGKPERQLGNHKQIKSLAVDHNHKTGKVRSLLCAKCNSGIGHFDDDITLFRAVIAYLKKHAE